MTFLDEAQNSLSIKILNLFTNTIKKMKDKSPTQRYVTHLITKQCYMCIYVFLQTMEKNTTKDIKEHFLLLVSNLTKILENYG